MWNIKPNKPIEEVAVDKKKTKDKKNRLNKSQQIDPGEALIELKWQEEDDEQRSIRSVESIREIAIFAEQKQHKKMLLERMHRFGHMVTTIVKDKQTGKF